MKKTNLLMNVVSIVATISTLGACTKELPKRKAHKDEAIYSATIDGVKKDKLTWAQSYDAVIAKTKVTSGEERIEYLHQAEDILMSTGAICPLYYYTDIFMKDTKMTGYYSSPLGYKFFHRSTVNGSGEFTVCVGPKGDSFDPAINSAVDGAIVISHAFEGLYRWSQPASGIIAGDLEAGQAASYTKTEPDTQGHVKYTFQLRDGLTWSDGKELKASDFANSWARAASGKLAADYGYMFDCIVGYEETSADADKFLPLSGVKADDAGKTIEVELISDVPYFLELTAFPTYAPVRLDQIEGSEDDWWTTAEKYIGNGPMKLTYIDNVQSGKLVFEPNEHYWDRSSVKATKLTMALSDDDDNQLANFEKGDWKFIDSVPNARIDELKTRPEYFVEGQLGTYYVIFNVNEKKLNKTLKNETQYAKFRKALGLLIDRNHICKEIGKAGQEPANTFVGKGVVEKHGDELFDWTEKSGPERDGKGYYKVGTEDFSANVKQAIEDIKSLGFHFDETEQKFTDVPTLTYLYNEGDAHVDIAEYLQAAFEAVGIKIQLESQEWATFLNTRKAGEYSIARNGWLADYNDACSFLDMWITNSGNNDAQFGR